MKTLIACLLIFSASVSAVDLYDQNTGKYLGKLGGNPYDLDSTSNPYGRYGSPYSVDSINNPYGQYGSQYSPDSPNNPYATNQPILIDRNSSDDY